MKTFPWRPTPENFELARLINHGILLESALFWTGDNVAEALTASNDLSVERAPELVSWLKAIPDHADPSFSVLYTGGAETMFNCQQFPEMNFDDDCLLYHEELTHHLNRTFGNVYMA